jgi:hypothetical protein
MIQVDRAHRALIWKELRQLLPLVYMLLGVTLALLILGSIVSSMMPGASVSTAAMLLTMPAFFAAGAGAILIGQEKESQTMQWVNSLPIDAKQIFRTKLLVAVAGLSAMWLIASPCLLLSDVMYSQFSRSLFPDPFLLSLGVWIVHSVYLTLCGIYSSWRCKNVFTGLMLSLALACIPYVLGQLSAETYSLFNFGYATDSVRLIHSGGWSIIGIAIVTLLASRASRKVLSPRSSPSVSLAGSTRSSEANSYLRDQYSPPKSQEIRSKPYQFSIAALIWQKAKHNRGKLTLFAILMFVGVGLFPFNSASQVEGRYLPIVLVSCNVLALLAVSWLGVVAFIGDGSSPAMRFLADRGVSPTRAWWGRHLIAFSIIATSTLVYIVAQRFVAAGMFHSVANRSGTTLPMLSAITVLTVLVTVYSLSQWTSQVLRVLAGTAFLAPLISGVVLVWLHSCWSQMGTPLWLMLAIVAFPLVATWTQMRRHMDGPRNGSFFAVHGLTFFAIFVLPFIWCWRETSAFPRITAQRRADMLASASQVSSPTIAATNIIRRESPVEKLNQFGQLEVPTAKLVAALNAVGESPNDWLEIDGDQNTPLRADPNFIGRALSTAQVMQLRWLDSLKEAPEKTQQHKEIFLEWIDKLTEMSKRLRIHWMIREQGFADRIEIALTRMLSQSDMPLLCDEESIQKAVAMLSDQAGRSESRRRAVLLSWHKYFNDLQARNRHGLGGYTVPSYLSHKPFMQQSMLRFAMADLISSELLKLIDAGERGESTLAHREKLRHLTSEDETSLLPSPYSDRMQSSLYADQIAAYWQTPGCYWYAEWENAAKSLSSQLQAPKSNRRGTTDES